MIIIDRTDIVYILFALFTRANIEEELPSIGVTRNLVSVFRQKEEETKNTPVYKPSGAGYRVCIIHTLMYIILTIAWLCIYYTVL